MINQKSRVGKVVSIVILILLFVVALGGFYLYDLFNSYPSNSPTNLVLNVEQKTTFGEISKQLKKSAVIKEEWVFNQKSKDYSALSLGQYNLTLPATVDEILKQLSKQSDIIKSSQVKVNTFKFLINEGMTLDEIIDKMTKTNNGYTIPNMAEKEEIQNYLKDPKNFDRSRFAFLPEPKTCTYGNVNQCAKYYPEGYIYPATYDLEEGKSYKDYFNSFLEAFEKRVVSSIGVLDNKKLEKVITVASVIERETGYGNRNINSQEVIAILKDEREEVAGVFVNREKIGMKWQSNPTTHYGTPYKLCETTIVIPNCVFLDDRRIENSLYNTYTHLVPIAPISNPSLPSIQAALNPKTTKSLFFIADKTGKTRFASTDVEFKKHEQDILNGR
jgi:UPF0755 protein